MKRSRPNLQTIVAAVTLGVATAVAFFVALTLLSRPQDFAARAATLDQQLARAERISKSHGNPYTYPAGTICDATNPGADALKRRVLTTAAATNISLSSLVVDPPSYDATSGRVAPVSLQLAASGKYEAVLSMLGSLANVEPKIFVDTLDLKPASGGTTNLKLTGKVLCWTTARN